MHPFHVEGEFCSWLNPKYLKGDVAIILATKLTFAELFDRWKSAIVPPLKDSTARNYLFHLKSYLVPAFGAQNFVDSPV